VFDLFDTLGATEEQLDFPVIYASAINGVAGEDFEDMAADMSPLFQAVVDKVAPPEVNAGGALAASDFST
jgi:GTP-binding protein